MRPTTEQVDFWLRMHDREGKCDAHFDERCGLAAEVVALRKELDESNEFIRAYKDDVLVLRKALSAARKGALTPRAETDARERDAEKPE